MIDPRLGERLVRKAQVPKGLVICKISEISTEAETAYLSGPAISRGGIDLHHPSLGANSWIRHMPDNATGALVSNRVDTGDPQIMGYTHDDLSRRVQVYRTDDTYTYRPLHLGEIDIQSSGRAGVFLSDKGVIDIQGGPLRFSMNPLSMLADMETPSFRIRGLSGDEFFHGVAFRPNSNLDYVDEPMVTDGTLYWRKEAGFSLGDPLVPALKMVDVKWGHILDEAGAVVKGRSFNNDLRYRALLTDTEGGITRSEIDDKGNVTLWLSNTAVDGLHVNVPKGNIRVDAAKMIQALATDARVDLKQTLDVQANKITTSSILDTSLTARTLTLVGKQQVLLSSTAGSVDMEARPAPSSSFVNRVSVSKGGVELYSFGGGIRIRTETPTPISLETVGASIKLVGGNILMYTLAGTVSIAAPMINLTGVVDVTGALSVGHVPVPMP